MVEPVKSTPLFARAFAILLALIGLVVAGGGVELALLGGSLYYVLGGIAVLATAWFLWRGDRRAGTVYGSFLVATLLWALWEVGADGWALAPRLIAPAVLGLLFALPAVRRTHGGWLAPLAAFVSLLVVVMVGVATSQEPGAAPVRQRSLMAGIESPTEWPVWGRTSAGERFAPLDQINPDNVKSLEVAWTYHTGVDPKAAGSPMIATPIMIGDRLYTCTQTNIVMALDPDTGKELWRFDPKVKMEGRSGVTTCRGVAFFRAPQAADCQERIVTTTFDAELLALDARTGKLCPSFGKGGRVDMTAGMGDVPHGFYYGSSAPTIVRGTIVLGGWVADNQSTNEPSGVIRGFDAVTGQFKWAWDIGRPGNSKEPGPGEEYTRSTPNSWAPMSGDEALGLVYVPTGNPTPDHWGGKRSAATDKYGSSVVAIDVETGAARWSFQTSHRDLWDYDVASQPTLFDYTVGGKKIPAVAQATKRGLVFILDRRTGAPLVPVEERAAPQRGKAPDERLSPTQPYPVGFPSFAGDRLTEKDMWGVTPLDQLWCRIEFRQLRYDGESTPPGLDRSLTYPSIGGGMNYGGVALDPERDIMIVNSLYYGTILQLVPRAEADRLRDAAASAGSSHAVTNFAVPLPMAGTPYGARITGLMSPLNAPCNKPPYGKISAVDMRTNKLLWSRPIGSARDTGPFGIASHLPIPMGMPMFGGSMVTRSGLTFIGATQDRSFRALDTASGRILWSTRLPGGAQANPMSYVSPRTGRQYVVVSAGGHVMLSSPMADTVVAFALPKK